MLGLDEENGNSGASKMSNNETHGGRDENTNKKTQEQVILREADKMVQPETSVKVHISDYGVNK